MKYNVTLRRMNPVSRNDGAFDPPKPPPKKKERYKSLSQNC